MSLTRPILDDRSYEQLRDELLRRIPSYTPEWSDHNASDPGITLIELFAYLGENLLYRFNQIPDATYMEYLRLLQIPLRPAKSAQAMLALTTKEPEGVRVEKGSVAKAGKLPFETQNEVRVLPLSVVAVAKLGDDLPSEESEEAVFYKQAYQAIDANEAETAPYQTVTLWHDEPGVPVDFDKAVDGIMWLAVLAEKADNRDEILTGLATHEDAPLLLNIGFVPDQRVDVEPGVGTEEYAERFRCPGTDDVGKGPSVEWQILKSELDDDDQPTYVAVNIEHDTSAGLSQEGVVRVKLPRNLDEMGPVSVVDEDRRGTGDLPPPVNDELEGRLLFWLRAFRRDDQGGLGSVLYVGANATTVIQQKKARSEFLGTGTGQPGQQFNLINKQIIPGSVVLEVEGADNWQAWQEVSGFHTSHDHDLHFKVDAEAGNISFGNGVQGFVPQIGQRIRIAGYRYGGGVAGNVAADGISKLEPALKLKVANPLAAWGGGDAEGVEAALDRIPAELRRRDRAVTEGDFQELALATPGANIGRAECLPRFHPAAPDEVAAGVISVVVWPTEDAASPNAPMPNRTQLGQVCKYLDARRLVTTEHYVIAPTYRPVAVAVGLQIKPGYGVDAVRHWVELVIRQYLAPLPPYGPSGEGWPLGRVVYGPELEAAALQVEGVEYIRELKVVARGGEARDADRENHIALFGYEVAELLAITVEEGDVSIDPAVNNILQPDAPVKPPVPIPVIKEVC